MKHHYTCFTGTTNGPGYQAYDAMDVYNSNRLTHAMLSYIFEGNNIAKNVVLGNNSPEQKNIGNIPSGIL